MIWIDFSVPRCDRYRLFLRGIDSAAITAGGFDALILP
ncbi:hypothetical protein C8R27_103116 [Nitrosomonas ureae]|nr:hypothetical protein C8R27_103116 [Nitrosomonas ureae]